MISVGRKQEHNRLKVLSLFDGMSCGMLAMIDAGIVVDRYVAYEIDKYAIETSSHNFNEIEHMGNVFGADFTQYKGFDILIGGSPCTFWSKAKKFNRETTADGDGWNLFSQFPRALQEAKPMFFIYENNKSMSMSVQESISNEFGFTPYCINSELTSAQHRQRLYWVGVRNDTGGYNKLYVPPIDDLCCDIHDVLRCGEVSAFPINTVGNKSYAIKRTYHKSSVTNFVKGGCHYPATGVAVPACECDQIHKVYTVLGGAINVGGELYPVSLKDGNYIIRKLSIDECKSLQNIPDWYEFPVSDTQAYRMLGNGWTIGVISHLLKATQSYTQ